MKSIIYPLPNLLVIGAMKSATTTLHMLLDSHPEIHMSSKKEIDFFSDNTNYSKGIEWYNSHFHGDGSSVVIGETSPNYTKFELFPDAAERIYLNVPDVKLIYIMRHPLERLHSHWFHAYYAYNGNFPPLKQAVQDYPNLIDTSLYFKQINKYREYFPDEKILLLFYEDIQSNIEFLLKNTYNFLSVNNQFLPKDMNKRAHVSSDKKVDSNIVKYIQSIPGSRYIAQKFPFIRHNILPYFRSRLPDPTIEEFDIPEDVKGYIIEDSMKILEYAERPNFWNFY